MEVWVWEASTASFFATFVEAVLEPSRDCRFIFRDLLLGMYGIPVPKPRLFIVAHLTSLKAHPCSLLAFSPLTMTTSEARNGNLARHF